MTQHIPAGPTAETFDRLFGQLDDQFKTGDPRWSVVRITIDRVANLTGLLERERSALRDQLDSVAPAAVPERRVPMESLTRRAIQKVAEIEDAEGIASLTVDDLKRALAWLDDSAWGPAFDEPLPVDAGIYLSTKRGSDGAVFQLFGDGTWERMGAPGKWPAHLVEEHAPLVPLVRSES